MRLFSIGDLVVTTNPDEIGEVVGLSTTVDGQAWQWGAARFSAGPYVVRVGREIRGLHADDLSYVNWNAEEPLRRIWQAVFGKESAA